MQTVKAHISLHTCDQSLPRRLHKQAVCPMKARIFNPLICVWEAVQTDLSIGCFVYVPMFFGSFYASVIIFMELAKYGWFGLY